MNYQGDFEGDFELTAKQFIVRENDEIAFVLEGSDEWVAFIIEGIAKRTQHGFYMAPRLDLNYINYNSDDQASIRIDRIKFSPKRERCKVNITWLQGGEDYFVSGNLRHIKA